MAHEVTAPAMQRVRRLLNETIRPNEFRDHVDFSVKATEEAFDILPFDQATSRPLTPFEIGGVWGRAWHTRWFRLLVDVPANMADRELVAQIDLGFDGRYDGFQAEGMVWRKHQRQG